MKACKISTHIHAHTHTHTHTNTDILQKLIFYNNLLLLTILGFFKRQMSKESLIVLSNVLFHAFTKLKQYDQLPENYNPSFKIYCEFAA